MAHLSRSNLHLNGSTAGSLQAQSEQKLVEELSKEVQPHEKDGVPNPAIFESLAQTRDVAALPTVAECVTHLQLLEAFLILKQKVLTSNALDRAFSIVPANKIIVGYRRKKLEKDTTFDDRRLAKWPVFVRLAAIRFLAWWENLAQVDEKTGRITDISLPSLDVLLIWHAFMLHPQEYRSFVEEKGWLSFSANLPWGLIHQALTNDNRSFVLPNEAAASFEKAVGQVDLFNALIDYEHHTEPMKKTMGQLITSKNKSLAFAELPGFKQGFIFATPGELLDTIVAMVVRTADFTQNIGRLLWLRSPALEGTMDRAISRYTQFLQLFGENKGTLLVPSLDIDLVWRTHKCHPTRYRMTCEQSLVTEADPDELVEMERSENGLLETSIIYESRFKTEYCPCLCWECEAMKSAMESLDTTGTELKNVALDVTKQVRRYRAVEFTRRVVR